jgi:hypothetical protein
VQGTEDDKLPRLEADPFQKIIRLFTGVDHRLGEFVTETFSPSLAAPSITAFASRVKHNVSSFKLVKSPA